MLISGCARMAELADALGSGPSPRKGVEVRVLFRAPSLQELVSLRPAYFSQSKRPMLTVATALPEGDDGMVEFAN